MLTISLKIQKLRKLFKSYNINAYLVPSFDEFQNEYIPVYNKRLEWLTGFSGSAGSAIVTSDNYFLLTDGRYLLQAGSECQDAKVLDIKDLKADDLNRLYGLRMGYDPAIYTKNTISRYVKLSKELFFSLIAIESNLIDKIWTDRPQIPFSNPFTLDEQYSGLDASTKICNIITKIDSEADYLLITDPASVSWLLNIRAHDIPYNHYMLSRILISKNREITIFANLADVRPLAEVMKVLGEVSILQLNEMSNVIQNLSNEMKVIQVDYKNLPLNITNKLKKFVDIENPCLLPKACKNPTEIDGIKKAHVLDGAAICKFLFWLECNKDNGISEIEASSKLFEFRSASDLFYSPSFQTISAYGSNGAIIHYNPMPHSNKLIGLDNLYLIDSGGHYLCGTTDVTRTICLGEPTEEQKLMFTLVLKGNIALSTCNFPEKTNGIQLDVLARRYLWGQGLNYQHGTGHGVGHFLSVHESPPNISSYFSKDYLQSGMICSIEPGYYKPEKYGIRIENLVLIKPSNYLGFLEFETLTLVPIDNKLILFDILTSEERVWLAHYNMRIKEVILPLLNETEKAYYISKLTLI